MSDTDPFDQCSPVPGLEHLGRAIVDANGIPSGSPANFENLRGRGIPEEDLPDKDAIIASLQAEFGAPVIGENV